MKKIILLLVVAAAFQVQAQIKFPFKSFTDFKNKLDSVCTLSDASQREISITSLLDTLRAHNKVPFTFKDSIAFLYRGDATTVSWAGDFSGWNPDAGGFKGTKIGNSNVWICINKFPANARLDYKIVVGSTWILDPANPFTQYSGVGSTNSELRMPDWVYPQETIHNPLIPGGILSENLSLQSINLGYAVYYKVYTPAGYENSKNLPVVYTTDGHEYSDERLGSMINVLDNLIYGKKIKPVIAVFIDPRTVPNSTGINRRGDEYTINKKYADFVADELVPFIDSKYKTDSSPDSRAILGTSLGGINSAYFGAYRSDKFHLIGIHSPAFQAKPQIYDLYKNVERLPLKIFMSTGTINDTQLNALQLKSILDGKEYPLMYIEVPEGHSWGNWRALLDEPLIYFFKNDNSTGMRDSNPSSGKIMLGNYPNPFNPNTKIWFTLTKPEFLTMQLFNSVGQKIETLVENKFYEKGNHILDFHADNLSSGIYFYNLISPELSLIDKFILLK